MEDSLTLTLPKALFRNCFGLGIDSGCSCMKIVYTTEDKDNIHFHFAIFSQNDSAKAFDFIKEKCGDKLRPEQEVMTCGISANEQHKTIKDILGVKPKNVNESTAAVNAFRFLSNNLPWHDWILPGNSDAMKAGLNRTREYMKIYQSFKDDQFTLEMMPSDIPDEVEAAPETINYPIILNVIGSVPFYLLVHAGGTYNFKMWNPLGGKTFLGLGNYIAGTKSFEELHQMAVEGDHTKVDVMLGGLGGDPSDVTYGAFSGVNNLKGFSLGHLEHKAKDVVDSRDVISALLSTIIHSAVRESVMNAAINKVSQVFYIGSLPCRSQMVRDQITSDYVYETHNPAIMSASHHYFVKHGSYINAIGVLLENLAVK